jgi:hypothetical protein
LDDLEESLIAIKHKKLPRKTNIRLKSFADEVINSITRSRDRKGAVCAIQFKGEVFLGRSFKGYERGKFPELHPLLDHWVKKRWKLIEDGKVLFNGQHGKCAEVDALNKLLLVLEKNYGKLTLEKVKRILGGNTISKALEINKKVEIHGKFKEACLSCNPMLKEFNIIEDLTELIN